MKIVRFRVGRKVAYGIVEGQRVYTASGNLFRRLTKAGYAGPLEAVKVLPPVQPGKIIGLGKNYLEHAREMGASTPAEPLIFLKAPTAVVGQGEVIVMPPGATRVDHEGELAVVLGRRARNVAEEDVDAVILGYTCANDVTERDLQAKDGQWARAKSFDTFCPLGPYLVTGLNPGDLDLTCRVNGQILQKASTSQMVFGVRRIVSFISRVMTLMPGDVVLTGTPAGISPLKAGDIVEVEIDGIGVLRNPVAATPPQ